MIRVHRVLRCRPWDSGAFKKARCQNGGGRAKSQGTKINTVTLKDKIIYIYVYIYNYMNIHIYIYILTTA